MKPKFSEYLVILLSLAAIFVCGCGIGFFYAKNQAVLGIDPITLPRPDPGIQQTWEQRTLENLNSSLGLSENQLRAVAGEIETTSLEVAATRKQALGDYYTHLLTLHERILPHLTPPQKERMIEDREKLKKLIDSR